MAIDLSPQDERLQGPELRAAILRLHERNPEWSCARIAEKVSCSKQHVAAVLAKPVVGGMGRPPKKRIDIPAPVLERMLAVLRSGEFDAAGTGKKAAYDATLLALPGVAKCFAGETPERQRVAIRLFISAGKDAADGPARELYRARQEGLLRRNLAA